MKIVKCLLTFVPTTISSLGLGSNFNLQSRITKIGRWSLISCSIQYTRNNWARQFVSDNSAQSIYYKFYKKISLPLTTQQFRFHFSNFSSIPLPFRKYFLSILSHIVLITIGLLIEYMTLYTDMHYNRIKKFI